MTVQESDRVWITLSPENIATADNYACLRRGNAVSTNFGPANNAPTEHDAAMKLDLAGSRGECATSLYLHPIIWNAFVPGRTAVDQKLPDFEVRGIRRVKIDAKTRSEDWHDLMIQFDDDPGWAYLLVLGHAHPHYCIVGWVWGKEGMQERFRADPAGGRPAYFIPQNDPILRPPADLLRGVRLCQSAGNVGYDKEGRFLHYCECGKWGSISIGAFISKGILGTWYCQECHPSPMSNSR